MNPFRPGAGRRPPLLAGRTALLDEFAVRARRCEELGEGDRGLIVSGLRGVGKTALLTEIAQRAGAAQWIVAQVEAGSGASLLRALAGALELGLRTATGKHRRGGLRRAVKAFKSFEVKLDTAGAVSVGVGFDLAAELGVDLLELLDQLGQTARELGIGVLVAIDELQEATVGELRPVNAALHAIAQQPVPVPVVFVGTGLPSLPVALADANSYAERLFDYRPIGLLTRADARQGLVGPTESLGVLWRENALTTTLREVAGYPYFLQAYGKHIWDAAVRSPISRDDVETGLTAARAEIGDGVYRARWDRATPKQRELLRAMARLMREQRSHTVRIGDLPAALGRRRVSDLSVARRELLRKGLVYVPERGRLAFTVPWMDRFIRDET